MESLAGNMHLSENDKLGEVSRQFEAVLLRQILQSAQKTHFATKFSGDSATSGIYKDMATTQLADSISMSGAFGLAQSLKEQLKQELPSKVQVPS